MVWRFDGLQNCLLTQEGLRTRNYSPMFQKPNSLHGVCNLFGVFIIILYPIFYLYRHRSGANQRHYSALKL